MASPALTMLKRNGQWLSQAFQEISLLLGDTVGCSENPGLANKSSSTKVLVQAVDQRHLPTPLPRGRVLTTNHSTTSVLTLHPANIFVGHRVDERRPFICCGEGIGLVRDDLVLGIVPSPIDLFLLPESRRWFPLSGGQLLPEAAPFPSQSLLLLLHRRLRGAADGLSLGATEQLGSLGVSEAREGEVRGNASAGAFGTGICLLSGCGRCRGCWRCSCHRWRTCCLGPVVLLRRWWGSSVATQHRAKHTKQRQQGCHRLCCALRTCCRSDEGGCHLQE